MSEPIKKPPVFFLIAGEASGDLLGVRIMQALRKLTHGEARFMGIGGARMRNEGLELLFPQEELAHMGLIEIVRHIPHIISRIHETVATVLRLRPDAVITIDSPDFCFRVAKKLKANACASVTGQTPILLIHYVAPTVWAWRPGRAKTVARFLDHLLALLPFEPPYFTCEGLPTTFVGHSIVESAAGQGSAPRFYAKYGVNAGTTLISVLPGSRRSELKRLLPIFAATIVKLKALHPDLHVVIPAVSHFVEHLKVETRTWGVPVIVVEGDADKYDAFAASRVALACSGTVAVELAMARLPAVIAYRVGSMTAFMARRLIKTKYFSLANIMHDKLIVPELIQENCTPDALASAIDELLTNREVREAQIDGLGSVAAWLGQGQFVPSERAAETILELVRRGVGPKSQSVRSLPALNSLSSSDSMSEEQALKAGNSESMMRKTA